MKALILNSGIGKRMGDLTSELPKCMTQITDTDTIISRQLKQLYQYGIRDVIITTGPFDTVLSDYCESLNIPINYTFINNPKYISTNYIYSIFLSRDYLQDDIILMHGDLVFEDIVLLDLIDSKSSCMVISSSADLPEKDFKAVLLDGKVLKIGVEFFENAVAAQPIYKLLYNDWNVWLNNISKFCDIGQVNCYAENAFNEVSNQCNLRSLDVNNTLCNEIDTPNDLSFIKMRLKDIVAKSVYMCFSTDIIHGGHIEIINKASKLGGLVVGVLSDEAVASYKRFPLLSFEERKEIVNNIKGVNRVILQNTLSYVENIKAIKPDYVVHGDDWKFGLQRSVRDEVINELKTYGGRLVEFPYSKKDEYKKLEQQSREQLSIPDIRRGRLRKLLSIKKLLTIIEAHSGITGLIAEKTIVYQDGKSYQFDGMWVSSLCDSTAKGKPDIELVDMSSRIRTIDDIMEVTTKPIILDGDTGGLIEHFVYNVRSLERMGVSAVIIEDKTGLKKNSLFGTDVEQTQDSIDNFCAKIIAGKRAQKTKEFMIIARIESLILDKGMTDALDRAFAYVNAGADGIMIHSRRKDPTEIFEFCEQFRDKDKVTPLVVVPTSYNTVTEEELAEHGVNIVIYANHLTRSGIPSMKKTAETLLFNHRAKEADDLCMSIKDIIELIPEE
jgi:phosphoenolpyruvate phosphomutase